MFTGLVNEYRDLLHQSEEESDRLWKLYDKAVKRVDVANAELDKLAFDYNQLADTLCRTDDLLAQTEDKLAAIEAENNRLRGFLPVERPHPLDTILELRGQLAEAVACVRKLIAWVRHGGGRVEAMYGGMGAKERAAWLALPAWLRREIEK